MHYLIIGTLTCDVQPTGWTQGGTGTFASRALVEWGAHVVVASPLAMTTPITLPLGTRLLRLPSVQTATFHNTYNGDTRQQWLYAAPDVVRWEMIPAWARNAAIVHLAPLAGELTNLPPRSMFGSAFVGLTAQGLLRTWDTNGQIRPQSWNPELNELRQVDAIVVSEEDVAGDETIVQHWAATGVIAALTRGSHGATIWHAGSRYDVAAIPTDVIDPTGAGDVWAAAFFWRLQQRDSIETAARWACVQAAHRIGTPRG